MKAATDEQRGLFRRTAQRRLYPSPSSGVAEALHTRLFEFTGRLLGKAIYEGIVLDAALADFFAAKLLGKPNSIDELPSLDPELHASLQVVKTYEGDVENDLCLSFVLEDDVFGVRTDVELRDGGAAVPVTAANRIECAIQPPDATNRAPPPPLPSARRPPRAAPTCRPYARYVHLVADYRLNRQIEEQSRAFVAGVHSVVPLGWLRLFSTQVRVRRRDVRSLGGATQRASLALSVSRVKPRRCSAPSRRSCNASSTATTRPSILPTCGAIRAMRAATPSSRRRCATCGECLATSPPRTRRSSSSLSPRARARRCWASSIYNPLSRFSVYRAMAATRRRSWPSSALGGTRRSDCPLPPPALTYSSCPTSSRALCCANGSSTPSAPPRVLSYHDAGCVPGRAQGGRLCSLGLQTLVAPWMWRTDSEIARAALCHLIVSLPPL